MSGDFGHFEGKGSARSQFVKYYEYWNCILELIALLHPHVTED